MNAPLGGKEAINFSRSGTYTVSGGVEGAITNVSVNTLAAALYTDKSYAKAD
jgi:hypothetical protein